MEKEKFYEWIDEYGDALFSFAHSRVNHKETAEDLVQETFLAAWRNREKFRSEMSDKNWLYMILKNKIIDHYRSRVKNMVKEPLSPYESSDYFNDKDMWLENQKPALWDDRAFRQMENKEFLEVLENCKSKLNETQNAVFTMKYLDDQDAGHICKELGITSSNYWVLIHRAKLQLRKCLELNWL